MLQSRWRNRTVLAFQVSFNLMLAVMLWGTMGLLFFVPYDGPVEGQGLAKLTDSSAIIAIAFAISSASGALYLYRRQIELSFVKIMRTPPVKVWFFVSVSLVLFFVFLASQIESYLLAI